MVLSQTPWEQSLGPAHCPTDGSGFQGLHPCEALSLGHLSVKWEQLYLPGSYSGPGEGGGVGNGSRVLSRGVATAIRTSGSGPRGKVS